MDGRGRPGTCMMFFFFCQFVDVFTYLSAFLVLFDDVVTALVRVTERKLVSCLFALLQFCNCT